MVNTSAGYPPAPPYPIVVEPPPGKYFLLSKVVLIGASEISLTASEIVALILWLK